MQMWSENMYNLSLLAVYYFFYSALGWSAESIYCSLGERKWINRGFLTGPLCPIYGAGAVVMTVFLKPLKEVPVPVSIFGAKISITPLLVFLAGMILADIVEFVTSVAMEKLFHARWWDYSEKPFNIQGRICLQHTMYWGISSVVFVYLIHPFFSRYAEMLFPPESPKRVYTVILVILVIFVLDIINAVRNAMDVKKVMDKVHKLSDSITNMANDIKSNAEVKFDEFQASAVKRAEKFAAWRGDIAKQTSEIVATFGITMRGKSAAKEKSRDKVNRLINGYPNFRRIAKNQLIVLEELLAEIKKRITDDDEEMY
jgi:uncharacterized membrane protein